MWACVMLEFSAAEAAHASGVSTALQRDWRRRRLIAERTGPGRAKFTVMDILTMAAMRALSDAGLSVKASLPCAARIASNIQDVMGHLPGGATFEDVYDASGAEAWWHDMAASSRFERYLVVPLPDREEPSGSNGPWWRENLSDLHELIGDGEPPCVVVFDALGLMTQVWSRLQRPVVRIEDAA